MLSVPRLLSPLVMNASRATSWTEVDALLKLRCVHASYEIRNLGHGELFEAIHTLHTVVSEPLELVTAACLGETK